MILTDIYVPAVDKTYNFNLNEDVEISKIIAEVIGMLEQKEKAHFVGEQSGINLYEKKQEQLLPRENTLYECDIRSGAKLILV